MPTDELTRTMTDEQRFLFDLNGFVVIRSALCAEDVARYVTLIQEAGIPPIVT